MSLEVSAEVRRPVDSPSDRLANSVPSEPIISESYASRDWMILAAGVFTIALIIRLFCFTGLIASDDLDYANHARQISQGTYGLQSYTSAVRYGVFIPVAAFYSLFGVHEWTTVAAPLIASSVAAMLLVLIAAQLGGWSVALIAGLLAATFPVDVRYASILVPEPFLQAILLTAALLFVIADKRNSGSLGICAGISLGFAYLTKEPAVFVLAAFIAYALWSRRWRLVCAVAIGFALVLAVETICYWLKSGDLFFRLHALAAHNSDVNDKGLREANDHLVYRLWQTYPRMMLMPNIDFGLHSVFVLGLSTVALLSRGLSKTTRLLLLWAAVPFAYLNFGTSSFSFYWALPAAPRYITVIYPPLFLLSAMLLVEWAATSSRQKFLVGVTVAIVCSVGIYCAVTTRATDYRTAQVERLKQIVVAARSHDDQICEFAGSDGSLWRQTLRIIAPDRIGCSGSRVVKLLPDSDSLPISEPL